MDGLATPPLVPPLPNWVPQRALDVRQYHAMGEAGLLRAEDRVELIEGALIEMGALGTPHMGRVMILTKLLGDAVGSSAILSVRNAVRLNDHSEPQPDLALMRPRPDRYCSDPRPMPPDILLLIEVSDSSLRYDREVKAPLYARHGITEYWIVDLEGAAVLRRRDPTPQGYATLHTARAGEPLDLPGLTGVQLAVADILEGRHATVAR